jgi:hypothetical protein
MFNIKKLCKLVGQGIVFCVRYLRYVVGVVVVDFVRQAVLAIIRDAL